MTGPVEEVRRAARLMRGQEVAPWKHRVADWLDLTSHSWWRRSEQQRDAAHAVARAYLGGAP